MKGIVFTLLADMVEENFGLEAWDALLSKTGLDGIYVSTESYDDEELFKLVGAAHEATGIEVNDLVKAFGKFSFSKFQKMHPDFCDPEYSLKQFLLTVDQVIHVEVKKLHPDAMLPSFDYVDESDSELTMLYNSPRKLCMLAEGLIAGAAEYYKTEYELTHDECLHEGHDHCKLHLTMV